MSWRLLDTSPATGAWNMAVDEAVLVGVATGSSPSTLRLYGWSPGCVSIGRYQRAAELTDEARAALGVGWVRRPTGGRALYHGPEATYSVVAPLADPHVSGGVLESYRKVAEALVAGLELLGVRAALAGCGDPARLRSSPSCFDSPSPYELLHDGRKLAGSAQLRHGTALLQHGSVLLDDPSGPFFDALYFDTPAERGGARAAGAARLTTLARVLGHAPREAEVREAVAEGFKRCWGLELLPGELTAEELERARELEDGKYRSAGWCYRR